MHTLCKTSAILIVFCVAIRLCVEEESGVIGHPVVHTKLGLVKGITQRVLNSSVNIFYGIPYAKPPLGHLRFKHPVSIDSWTGTLNCTVKRKACFQYKRSRTKSPVPETEDCLYVNVYVPKTAESSSNGNSTEAGTGMSVMFFIFGGNFLRGATEWYDSRILAAVSNVITVAVSYRIGAFGYLFSGTPEAPGNAGSFDQLMALEWVRDNIGCFGGDPNSITIFGDSSGGYCTGHLMVSPLSRNLFHRAILMSGVPISSDAVSNSVINSLLIIEEMGNFTGCNRFHNTTIPEIVVCLENLMAEMVDLAQESITREYRPILDGHFLSNNFTHFYNEVVGKNISVFLGVVKDEGSLFVENTFDSEFTKPENTSNSHQILLDVMNSYVDSQFHITELQKYTINYVYGNWDNINDIKADRQKLEDFMGDCSVVCPTNQFGIELSDRNISVFYYKFDHRAKHTPWPEWMGVVHGDDLNFVFGQPLKLTEEELEFSYHFMKIFGNFAKFGDPSYEGFSWPRFSRENRTYVALDTSGDTIGKDLRRSYCDFWNGIYPLWYNGLDIMH